MKRILSALLAGLISGACALGGIDIISDDDNELPLIAAGRLDLDDGFVGGGVCCGTDCEKNKIPLAPSSEAERVSDFSTRDAFESVISN